MSVRNISIDAYYTHIDSGKAFKQWMSIFDYMLESTPASFTRAEIAQRTGMRDSSVCGRVNELLGAGLLVEQERRKCTVTGSPAHPVAVNYDDPKQGRLL